MHCVLTVRKRNGMTENGKFLISVGSLDESVFQWFSASPVRHSRPSDCRSGLQRGAQMTDNDIAQLILGCMHAHI